MGTNAGINYHDNRVLAICLGLSAGVMTYVSLVEMLEEAAAARPRETTDQGIVTCCKESKRCTRLLVS